MVITLLASGIAMLLQATPAQTVAIARRDGPKANPAAPDSARALRMARRAQDTFELVRRNNMPHEYGVGSHPCDVRVGRWCVWNDETNDRKPPPESPRTREARDRLLAVLDTIGSRFPADEWVAAQRVRYLTEAKRYADAVHVAERCTEGGSRYRCRAFAAVALHDSGAVRAADSAFTAALAAMPDSVRCTWSDISVLVDDELADRYAHADCAARREIETTFWSLTTPLYLRDHDFRNEFLARVTRSDMELSSRTPMGSPTEPAFRETGLRYGYDTWFVRGDPPAGSMSDVPIAGYREGGSGFNFVPAYEVFSAPAILRLDDWDLTQRSARTIYAPPYARRFRELTKQQVALFRRGDAALVLAAYDVGDDTLFARAPLEAGLFTAPIDSGHVGNADGTVDAQASPSGVLTATAGWRPMVVSLELLDSATRSAARARYAVTPPTAPGRLGVSDLLIFAPRGADSTPHKLADVLPLMLHGTRVSASHPLGVFWETYGVRPDGESLAVSLTIERIKEGWARRAAERLHLATPFSPMAVHWQEVPDATDHLTSRAVTLDLSRLTPGRYEISLTVKPGDAPPAVAKREIVVER
jgi:hypothetical protein